MKEVNHLELKCQYMQWKSRSLGCEWRLNVQIREDDIDSKYESAQCTRQEGRDKAREEKDDRENSL